MAESLGWFRWFFFKYVCIYGYVNIHLHMLTYVYLYRRIFTDFDCFNCCHGHSIMFKYQISKTITEMSAVQLKKQHLFVWNGNWSGNNEMKIIFLVVPEGIPLLGQMAVDCFWQLWEDVIHVITQWPRLFFYAFPLFDLFSTCFSTFWQCRCFGLLFGRQRCELTNRPYYRLIWTYRIIRWDRMRYFRVIILFLILKICISRIDTVLHFHKEVFSQLCAWQFKIEQ